MKTWIKLLTFPFILLLTSKTFSANENAINYILKNHVLKNKSNTNSSSQVNQKRTFASQFSPNKNKDPIQKVRKKIAKEKLKYLFHFGNGLIQKSILKKKVDLKNKTYKNVKKTRANILDLTESIKTIKKAKEIEKMAKVHEKTLSPTSQLDFSDDDKFKSLHNSKEDFLKKLKAIETTKTKSKSKTKKVILPSEKKDKPLEKFEAMKKIKPIELDKKVLEIQNKRKPTNLENTVSIDDGKLSKLPNYKVRKYERDDRLDIIPEEDKHRHYDVPKESKKLLLDDMYNQHLNKRP